MWADAQRDGRPAEYRWRPLRKFCNFCNLLVPRHKMWLRPAAVVPSKRALMLPIYESARCGCKVNFVHSKIPSEQKPPKCIYSIPAQETAKDRAKFGWPPVSDVAGVTKPRRETN